MRSLLIVPWDVAISLLSMLLAAGGGFTKWQISTWPMRLLTLFISYFFLINIVGVTLAAMNLRNLFLIHIDTLLTYSALALIFSCWYSGKLRQYIRLSIPAFIAFYLLLLRIGYENFNLPTSFSMTVRSVILAFISLYTLFCVFRESIIEAYRDERFWISLGTLFAFSSNAIIYSGVSSGITIDIWIVHNIFIAIGYLCYFGGYQWTRTHTIL